MELVHTEVLDGITYKLFISQDDIPVRGNAMASGDEAEDKAVEDEILSRLDDGDTWAWASVNVQASVTIDGEEFTGDDYLGGCCYHDTADFITGNGYYDDMKNESRDALLTAVAETINRAGAVQVWYDAHKPVAA